LKYGIAGISFPIAFEVKCGAGISGSMFYVEHSHFTIHYLL